MLKRRPMQKLPTPEEVRMRFSALFEIDPEKATDYLYKLGISSTYIKQEAIAKNICWESGSPYGKLECTINLSKPEKDPQSIAAALSLSQVTVEKSAIPLCDLCWENEEFPGTPEHPAKPGLRIAAITLGGERWGFQYSPYAYYPEHCIALSEQHRPMKIDQACFERLLDFADLFPFYFIGSNADLPIVGGSILSHDHFQGGRHVFPLMKAPIERFVPLKTTPGVQAGIVKWPASVLRLSSEDRQALLQAATKVLKTWQTFSSPACNITPFNEEKSPDATTKRICHNTLNPIVRKVDSSYIMDLVLRNNRTNPEYPWGIFHAPEHCHHIKKENIGLIEIMGLAILPPRLATELPAVEKALAKAAQQDWQAEKLEAFLLQEPSTHTHAAWAAEIFKRRAGDFLNCQEVSEYASVATPQGASLHPIIQEEIAFIFTTILEATGVFKRDAAGKSGWDHFIGQLNQAIT